MIADKIKRRRYQLLIHSCIYYRLDRNIISDDTWNKWAVELKELQTSYPEISSQVSLYEYFKDWDASTGAFLPMDLDWVISISTRLLRIWDKKSIKKKRRLF